MSRTLSQVDARLTDEILNRAKADKALSDRIAKLETATPPPVTPPGQIVRQCPASYTSSQFVAMMRDMTLDVIELPAGTRTWPLTFVKDLSRKARPLTVRSLPGVIFDGAGGSGGLLHFNTLNGPVTGTSCPTGRSRRSRRITCPRWTG